jgi:hypothetical protein
VNKTLIKSKTTWTGIAGIIAAIGGAVTGTMDIGTAIQTGVTSILAIFLRDGIEGMK